MLDRYEYGDEIYTIDDLASDLEDLYADGDMPSTKASDKIYDLISDYRRAENENWKYWGGREPADDIADKLLQAVHDFVGE